MKNIYLTYLALVSAITEESEELKALDVESRKLLEVIAVKAHNNTPLSVTHAMQLSQIGSPAMIHRKIGYLKDAGLIHYEHQENNRRTKYMKPTAQADAYFEKIGLALIAATK